MTSLRSSNCDSPPAVFAAMIDLRRSNLFLGIFEDFPLFVFGSRSHPAGVDGGGIVVVDALTDEDVGFGKLAVAVVVVLVSFPLVAVENVGWVAVVVVEPVVWVLDFSRGPINSRRSCLACMSACVM